MEVEYLNSFISSVLTTWLAKMGESILKVDVA